MSDVCIDVPNHPPISSSRKLAWLIAICFPFALIALANIAFSEPPALHWQTVSGSLLLVLVATAAATDLMWRKIPNWATYSAFGWGVVLNACAAVISEKSTGILGTVGLADCLAGAMIPFFFMLMIFSVTGGGAGDVKLTAAIGALLGLDRTIDVVLISFVIAGGFALIRAVWVQGPYKVAMMCWRGIGSWVFPLWILPNSEEQRSFMRHPMPLGPSFALGVLLVLFESNVQKFLDTVGSFWGGA